MFYPEVGNVVVLRDGRQVVVTDVSDPHPDAYRTYDKAHYDRTGGFLMTSEIPQETIMVGYTPEGRHTVVTDLSEVVSILE